MRIIAGQWRGKSLTASPKRSYPPHRAAHAPGPLRHADARAWGGHALLEGASVLDVFAGTGALGLEALSRGAVHAVFIDNEPSALEALRTNAAACKAQQRATIIRADALQPPRGSAQRLVFLDPPYAAGLVPRAVTALRAAGWIVPGTLVIAETGRLEDVQDRASLAHKMHGAAQVNVWREP